MLESSYLEVDVDGQEIFLVNMKILNPFSGRFRKLFSRRPMTSSATSKLKVIFHGFPGGAAGFELTNRFCYNNGRVDITPHNIVLLYCVSDFMEMEEEYRKSNLRYQTEDALRGISYWSWSELLVALRQCQSLLNPTNPSSFVQEMLNCIVERLSFPNIASSCTTSSDSSYSRCTCSSDSCSGSSLRSNCSESARTWWFPDLLFLNIDWICRITHLMLAKKCDINAISKFLLFYLRSAAIHAPAADKQKIAEAVISLISTMGIKSNFIPSSGRLFELHRLASRLDASSNHIMLLEKMIGSKLDEATIDHLLIRSPGGHAGAYDTNFVTRLCKAFLGDNRNLSCQSRLGKVSHLIDSYLYEVAPDPILRPSEFVKLVATLPEAARESHGQIYQAIATFCEVHLNAPEEEKLKMCKVLNLEKLSPTDLENLAPNSKFPTKIKVRALLSLQHDGTRSGRNKLK